jgi:predicted RNA-binding protein with PUA-like domain
MAKRYWLFKTEPDEFSIDDLAACPDRTTPWTGVRNYQARNLLRDEVKVGDEVLFYHSSTATPGVAGVARIVGAAESDTTALDQASQYFDRKATRENPIWVAVRVRFVRKLSHVIPLSLLKQTKGLEKMVLCQRGSRLSIQPVTGAEWRIIQELMAAQT